MVYCVQAYAVFATAARRDRALTAVDNQRAGKVRWGVDELWPTEPFGGLGFGLYAAIRFESEADGDTVFAQLSTLLDKQSPLSGSRLVLHTCTHDEATDDCTVTNERDW